MDIETVYSKLQYARHFVHHTSTGYRNKISSTPIYFTVLYRHKHFINSLSGLGITSRVPGCFLNVTNFLRSVWTTKTWKYKTKVTLYKISKLCLLYTHVNTSMHVYKTLVYWCTDDEIWIWELVGPGHGGCPCQESNSSNPAYSQ